MIYVVCSVKDNAVGTFGRPFFVRARGEALRTFMDEVNNPESAMFKHPGDYDLYTLGTFDDTLAEFKPVPPDLTMRAMDAVRPSQAAGQPL